MNAYDQVAHAFDLYLDDLEAYCQEYLCGLKALMEAKYERAVLASDRMGHAEIRMAHGPPAGDLDVWIAEHRLLLVKYPRTVNGKRPIPTKRRPPQRNAYASPPPLPSTAAATFRAASRPPV